MESLDKELEGVKYYDYIEARIKEFDKIDRSSYSFRYPQDTKGDLSLDNVKGDIGSEKLNTFLMKCVMDSIYKVFQGQSEILYREYGVE